MVNGKNGELEQRALCAIKRRSEDSENILGNSELCNKLTAYFRNKIPYDEIIDQVGVEKLGLKDSLEDTEIKRVLREVKSQLVDAETSEEHASNSHAISARKHIEEISNARREKMQELGFFVWSPEEHAFFEELWNMQEMIRTVKSGRRNHQKIAEALNDRFPNRNFTPQLTRRHAENVNTSVQRERRKRKRARRKANKNGNGHSDEDTTFL